MVPKRHERLPWRTIEGRSVIIHPQRGEVHELNPVGSFLWAAADGTQSLSELARALLEEFEGISHEEALRDASEFFEELARHELIQWQS